MLKSADIAKRTLVSSLALLLVLGSPLTVLANETQPVSEPAPQTTTTETPTPSIPPAPAPPANVTGPTEPTGADAKTYKYNAETGLWENDFYTWNPVTKQTKPKGTPNYSYNPDTGMWDTTKWQYNPATGKYEPNVISSARPLDATINNTGPDSTNVIGSGGNGNDATFNSFFNASISNGIYSTAHSGNAGVIGNTTGGSATTGNATIISNLFNLLQSSAGFGNGNLTTFNQDIYGNVVGDLYIDPNMFTKVQPATNGSGYPVYDDVTINSQSNGVINNDIVLDAATGNAAVSGNTTGGDATSGNASAVANIVNMINSIIGAQQSFLGNINIYGNLEGDVLLPENFINTLLASNVPTATIDTSSIANGDLLAEFNNNQAINNNIDATATSGAATVASNTTGGNATTGEANTKLTVLNLTGRQVIGSDAMLVFINVLGNWVGAIVNAPGSTSAALGGGIASNSCIVICGGAEDLTLNATNNNQINNNILANATTGNADVTHNTTGGNATTGDANVGVNVANITNSTFNLSNWFGVLFINVFGEWKGSFGVDTAYGNTPAPTTVASGGSSGAPQVFRFVPADSADSTKNKNTRYTLASVGATTPTNESASENNSDDKAVLAVTKSNGSSSIGSSRDLSLPIMGAIIAVALLGIERLITIRQNRRTVKATAPLSTLHN